MNNNAPSKELKNIGVKWLIALSPLNTHSDLKSGFIERELDSHGNFQITEDISLAMKFDTKNSAEKFMTIVHKHCDFITQPVSIDVLSGKKLESEDPHQYLSKENPIQEVKVFEQLNDDNMPSSATERRLRRLLCSVYASGAYMDDGEAHDSSVLPSIDFMRMPIDEIEKLMYRRATQKLEAALKLYDEEVATKPYQGLNAELINIYERYKMHLEIKKIKELINNIKS